MHEGLVSIADKGSVITWDFDVMRNDVVFTVYRLKNPLPMGCSIGGQAGQAAAAAGQPASANPSAVGAAKKDSLTAAGEEKEEAKSAKKSPPPSSKVRIMEDLQLCNSNVQLNFQYM